MLLGQKPMGSYCNELTEANLRDIVTELISMLFMMNILAFFKKSPRRLRALKRIGQLTLASFAFCLGLFAPALAQTPIRPEVAKSLQAAQDALKAGQLDTALALSQQTLAMPGITALEKPLIQRTLAVAALQG